MLEICVEDTASIDAAVAGGADRLELCAALSVGGLTPPASLIRAAAGCPLPVHLLARPRAGDFRYSSTELAMIAGDISDAAEAGLAGVVIGATREGHRLDTVALAGLIAHAQSLGIARGRPLSLTLHRAVDLCADLPGALEEAVALGFDRVLTSGGAPRAIDALDMLSRLARSAADRIIVLAGSGITAGTLPPILAAGVREVHASCRTPIDDTPFTGEIRLGFMPSPPCATSAAAVALLADIMAARQSA